MRSSTIHGLSTRRRSSIKAIQSSVMPWAPVACWLLIVYFMTYRAQSGPYPSWVLMHVYYPLLWCSAGIIAWLGLRYGVRRKPRAGRVLPLLAGLIGAFQIAVFVLAGLLFGFGNSPYNHRPWALLGNGFYVAALLFGVEISRTCLVVSIGKRRPTLALLLVSIFLTFIGLPPGRIASIGGLPSLLRVGGEFIMPALAEHVLASLLVLFGGPVPALIYRVVLSSFEWFSPVLPDLPWLVTSFLGTMAPALGLLLVQSAVHPGGRNVRRRARSLSPSWAIVGAASVAVLWFNTGLFGIQPTLVTGVSMLPTMRTGDIAITREVSADTIQVGDMIRFREQGVYVIHRVIELQQEGDQLIFTVQGDANNTPDPPVPASRLEGKVILIVPKLGWLGIGLRQAIGWIR